MPALHTNIQQPHGLPRLHPLAAFLHGRFDGGFPGGDNEAAPARHGASGAGPAGPLLAAPVAQAVHDGANVARIAFADFVQRQQAVIEHAGCALHAVGRGPPASAVTLAAPHTARCLQRRGFAGAGIAHEVHPARFGIAPCQQCTSECSAKRQQQHGIAHSRHCHTLAPAVQCAARGVLVAICLTRLEHHAASPGADDGIRQHESPEGGVCPAGLQAAANPLSRHQAQQVARQAAALVRVQLQPHGKQRPAQVGAVCLQQFHGHGPFPPFAGRGAKPQQPPEVVFLRVVRHCIHVQRCANPDLGQLGFAVIALTDAEIPDACTVRHLAVSALHRLVQHHVARTILLVGDGAGFCLLLILLPVRLDLHQVADRGICWHFGQCRDCFRHGQSSNSSNAAFTAASPCNWCRSLKSVAPAGRPAWNSGTATVPPTDSAACCACSMPGLPGVA